MFHHSQRPFFRSPQGAVPWGTKVQIRFYAKNVHQVVLRTWNGEEKQIPMDFDGEKIYTATIEMPHFATLFWYDFLVYHDGGITHYANNPQKLGGVGHGYPHQGPSFQITVYDPHFKTPDYLKNGIIYQIFPDRFYKHRLAAKKQIEASPVHNDSIIHENWNEAPLLIKSSRSNDNKAIDFFGGTLKGIEKKLPYLKELGISVIYLNPIFEAHTNHRYDTGDYEKIDPFLGTNAHFIAFAQKAKEMGIRLILDGVFSHTGEDSKYFNRYGHYPNKGAMQGEDSPFYSWYHFYDCGQEYECWWGIPTLPEVMDTNADFQRFLFNQKTGIVPGWLEKGASGWRLDVVDELSMPFLQNLRKSVKKKSKNAAIIGEVWEDASNKMAYNQLRSYCLGDTMDSVMNYPLRDGIISFLLHQSTAYDLARLIAHQQEVYPAPFYYALMNLIGSHDRSRIVNVLSGHTFDDIPMEERSCQHLTPDQLALGKQRLVKAFEILCALPGAPTLYYGDEAGMEGAADPFCRGTFPWGKEDRKLQKIIAALFEKRNQSQTLKTGSLKVFALDENTIRIVRQIKDGKDVFGKRAKNNRVVVDVGR